MVASQWFKVVSPEPPFIPWAPFTMTAGTSIDWVGYVSDAFNLVNPAGTITNEPSEANILRYLVYDPPTVSILMSLTGDCTTEILQKTLYIGDTPLPPIGASYLSDSDTTVVSYPGDIILVDGVVYPVQFIQS